MEFLKDIITLLIVHVVVVALIAGTAIFFYWVTSWAGDTFLTPELCTFLVGSRDSA